MAAVLTYNIFKCILLNKIKISLKFIPRSPIDNEPALVQVMAWRRIGDKPLSEPMLTWFTDAYMQHYGEMTLSTKITGWHHQTLLHNNDPK